MSASSPPIIAFELGVGEFRIVTPEAVYQIKVSPDLVDAARPGGSEERPGDPPAAFLKVCQDLVDAVQGDPEAGGEAAGPSGPDAPPASFFKEISEELFDKVGRLARKLSASVEALPSQLEPPDLDETGQRLENAKGQLEEVVKITEKASMTIIDTADLIQTDMDQLKNQLDILQNLDLMAEPAAPGEAPAGGGAPPAIVSQSATVSRPTPDPAFLDKLGELKAFVGGLLAVPAGDAPLAPEAAAGPAPAAAPAPPAAPATKTVTVVRFDVDVVFQTLYELCTNESVKDHIKRMREVRDAEFTTTAIADKLSEMAPTVDAEDGFYNFPIPAILKTLYGATASEDFRTTLKKMNQTSASIFLDSVLPIEGESAEVEVPAEDAAPAPAPGPEPAPVPEPEPAPAAESAEGGSACSREDLQAIQSLVAEIEQIGSQPAPEPAEAAVADAPARGGLYTSILTQDRDTIVKTVSMAHNLIQQTGVHLTRILETLIFQDLSGQRIMKVVALIGDLQRQLLSILVSVDTKIKVHQENDALVPKSEKAEQMAQEEVDKALEKVSGNSALLGPGAEARLDQGAVNDLLAQLGF